MISTLTSRITVGLNWNAQFDLTGSAYQPTTNAGNIQAAYNTGTAQANGAIGGGDQFVSYIVTITGSGSTTVDLTNITNILQQGSQSFAAIKEVVIRLLSPALDPVNGTDASKVVVGNAGSNPVALDMTSGTMTFNVKSGGTKVILDSSSIGICTVGAAAKNLKFTNSDTIAATVELTLIGSTTI